MGVLAERPELIDSWAADCAGLVHPDYVWHDMAQAWQTPDVGEQAIGGLMNLPDADKRAFLAGFGWPADELDAGAAAMDETMGRCVLALYRSAAQPAMRQVGEQLFAQRCPPGLVIIASEDHYAGGPVMGRGVAERLSATSATLDGAGHWWMLEQTEQAADLLAEYSS